MAAISGAHALLTNIVLAWNTSRMDGVVARLKRDGAEIEGDWLRRFGPAHFSHFNFRGAFRFNVERYADVLARRGNTLRARREPLLASDNWPIRCWKPCRHKLTG